jgi:hypothetical protein
MPNTAAEQTKDAAASDMLVALNVKEPPCPECGQPYIPNALREPVYKAVERILDEQSAWIARPSDEVTRMIAFSAVVAAQKIVDESRANYEAPLLEAGLGMLAVLKTIVGDQGLHIETDRQARAAIAQAEKAGIHA